MRSALEDPAVSGPVTDAERAEAEYLADRMFQRLLAICFALFGSGAVGAIHLFRLSF